MERIILASASPRRHQLLTWAEIPFDVIVRETEELYPPELSVEEVPVHIARNKAIAVQHELTHQPVVLAADTVVVLGDEIIGKPRNREEAIQTLEKLSGQTHCVITGVVLRQGEREIAFSDKTKVTFHTLTKEEIVFYVDHYHPYDKAGAYAIQEWIGVIGIQSVSGDFYNVMGLPVSRVVKALQEISF